ncbi:general transcription factor 3C polypeptide 5 [Aricia agestis]|uniref:general transcription factor 3C polypeptide 5 n=1 Tax=Aricia agestis TaxID=91739 RepID=UPI001C203F2F|nr:general transcription factor 3C polypeptide 5 [Aricia agestis]
MMNENSSELNNMHRELTCVLFPGVVKNDDKALQCMGGIKTISQVHSQSNKKRLGLSFQYDNPYVKKMHADVQPAFGVLFKIKVKKKKVGNEIKREVISTTAMGSVKKIYKFESMSDFQYLPVMPTVPGGNQFKCVLEDILPSGLEDVNALLNPCPSYILPANFTRIDKSTNYYYTDKKVYCQKEIKRESGVDGDTHRMRMDRSIPVARYTFNLTNDLPTEPHDFYIQAKKTRESIYPQLQNEYENVSKMFDVRPIWSINNIKFHTKLKTSTLKIILPCLAVYMKEGPWKMMWVKFGYDPRKDPEARIYQTLDFRLRHSTGVHTMVVSKDDSIHVKKTDRRVKKLVAEDQVSEEVKESTVCFRPGMILTQRQIFYQYCDIAVPEVQAAVTACSSFCHHKLGWLPPGLDDVCRNHVLRYAKEALLAKNSDLKFEKASSDSEASSDEADETRMDVDDEPSTSALENSMADASLS